MSELDPGIDLADLMVKIEMAKSKGEVRRLLAQGGIYLNGERVEENPYSKLSVEQLKKLADEL